jgi:hypothetical protein
MRSTKSPNLELFIFYFVNNHSDSTKKFSETEIINMLEFFIANTFAMLSGLALEYGIN